MVDQRLSELGLGDLVGRGEDGLQVSELLDEQGRGLRADPGDSGDIVDAVAHQREDIADLFGWHSELFDHLVDPDPAVVHRVEHVDVAVDQLHQILVRADDGHLPAGELGGGAIAGDDVVGLEPGLLDARDRKGASGGSDERELRDQILGRRRPVGLVLVVHLIAEGRCRGIENDRHVGRAVGLLEPVGELPEHRGIAIDRARRLAVTVGQWGQPMIGAKDVAGPVDQVEMGGGLRHEHGGLAASWRESTHQARCGGSGLSGSSRSRASRLVQGASTVSCATLLVAG